MIKGQNVSHLQSEATTLHGMGKRELRERPALDSSSVRLKESVPMEFGTDCQSASSFKPSISEIHG